MRARDGGGIDWGDNGAGQEMASKEKTTKTEFAKLRDYLIRRRTNTSPFLSAQEATKKKMKKVRRKSLSRAKKNALQARTKMWKNSRTLAKDYGGDKTKSAIRLV